MSRDSSLSWFEQKPQWLWWSLLPVLGGLAIAYAGHKTNTKSWLVLGGSIAAASLILLSNSILAVPLWPIWLAQVGLAFYLKKSFLVKTYPKTLPLPQNTELALAIAEGRGKLDLNECSKHDMVYGLGLPIVYANDIESLRNEGYIFTDAEELSELVGVPEATVARIAPLIACSYDYRKEADFSWRRLNANSAEELIGFGLEPKVAEKIVAERERGDYKSVADVKRRTGLPLRAYRQIV